MRSEGRSVGRPIQEWGSRRGGAEATSPRMRTDITAVSCRRALVISSVKWDDDRFEILREDKGWVI